MNLRWITGTVTGLVLSTSIASAGHLHYFGKDRQYLGRFDITEFVSQFKENQDKVFARYQTGWEVSAVAGQTNTFILKPKTKDIPGYVVVDFRETPNGAATATLTTHDTTSDAVVTDATLLFEDGTDLTPYAFSDDGKNTAYYLKFVQGFLVFVLSKHFTEQGTPTTDGT
ncbi:MAG: hypothetical protein KDK78_06950 [Chlamydiia bacterium]|nr:hypothetical protein [Chlamydiia bacterium]